MDHVHAILDTTALMHLVLWLGQGVLTAFAGYLAWRSKEQDKDRELKYRQMQMQLEHQTREIVDTVRDERMDRQHYTNKTSVDE